MANLINKDALATEIEKRLNYRVKSLKAINNGTYWKEEQNKNEFNKSLTRCAFNAVKNELFELKCILDTLEVKEVDLGKFGEIARHLIAIKNHVDDMRLNDDEWLLLEKIGYPEMHNIQK